MRRLPVEDWKIVVEDGLVAISAWGNGGHDDCRRYWVELRPSGSAENLALADDLRGSTAKFSYSRRRSTTIEVEAIESPGITSILFLAGPEDSRLNRDPDVARELLQEMEASSDWLHLVSIHQQSGPQEKSRFFHARLLADEGFLEASGKSQDVFRITNKGHDFLDLTRDRGRWETAKSMVSRLGGHSLTMLLRAAESIALAKLHELTGTKP